MNSYRPGRRCCRYQSDRSNVPQVLQYAVSRIRKEGGRAEGLMKDGEQIRLVANRMHDGQPLAGKIRSAWEGILEDAGLGRRGAANSACSAAGGIHARRGVAKGPAPPTSSGSRSSRILLYLFLKVCRVRPKIDGHGCRASNRCAFHCARKTSKL